MDKKTEKKVEEWGENYLQSFAGTTGALLVGTGILVAASVSVFLLKLLATAAVVAVPVTLVRRHMNGPKSDSDDGSGTGSGDDDKAAGHVPGDGDKDGKEGRVLTMRDFSGSGPGGVSP